MSSTDTAILRTLAYYDTFDYPLTVEELWRWIYPVVQTPAVVPSKEEVHSAIEEMVASKKLERQGEYIVFRGRASIVATRQERLARSEKLWARAASTARYLELVPFVKTVAVVNTLAINNVRPESDIDFLIIIAPNHIWISRLIVTGIVSLLGYRRHGVKIAGRICLSFYITTDALDFSQLQSAQPDTHFVFWTSQVTPLLDDGTYEKFVMANSWVTSLLPHAFQWDWKKKVLIPNASLQAIKKFYQVFFSSPVGLWIEAWARSYQLKRMEKSVESKAKLGTTEVIISEDVLKFHEMDRRQEYNERWQRRLQELGI